MRDIKYIIKRIIIGVGIALVLAFIKSTPVFALNGNFDSILVCSTNLGCNTSTTIPYSYAYADSARINFSSITLQQGKTYNINFYMNVTAPNFSFNTGYPQLFVLDSNGNQTRAFPDRGETLTVNNVSGNTYSVNWNFELDNTGGNYVTAYVIFTFNPSYNQNIYSTTFNSANLLYFDTADSNSNTDIIINNNQNTENIINNNNENTQEILSGIEENTNKEIESQKVCSFIDKNSVSLDNHFLDSSGRVNDNDSWGITNFISINSATITTTEFLSGSYSPSLCFYNTNKTLISCVLLSNLSQNTDVNIPNNSSYVRFSINTFQNKPQFKICQNGNQAMFEYIYDDKLDMDQIGGFFENFQWDGHGISGVVTAPLRLLNTFTTAQCSPLTFTLPFTHDTVSLPCMRGIYEEHFGVFFTLWQLLTTGLISYNVCINLYHKLHMLEEPNNDRIEVLNL